ncbi:hypothetical protein [Spirosoma endbachense]|uniref:Uncharacterized protein n=1 Tax=Spirosoma endbachense TaxID=2666025 RepID=A0A6P1W2P4_9BACT|nr:hypothetical protein [Spirosoma endbachense]QHV98277.1 hypothetical protein GJR95_26210 [Spirosoma endbachense]
MPEPTDDIPDYLPDGSLNIHGKLAYKFRINLGRGQRGKTVYHLQVESPSENEMKKRVDEAMDKAYRGE